MSAAAASTTAPGTDPITDPAAGSAADPAVGAGTATGVWASRWERWSQGQFLISGIVLCALSLVGRSVPASGGAATGRTTVCLVLGIAGAVVIVVPWVGRLRARPAAAGEPGGIRTPRPSVEQRLRASSYPKALWVYSAWVTVLAVLAVLAFLALAVGRHSPGFILGVVLFGIPAVLFGSLIWTTKDIWSRA